MARERITVNVSPETDRIIEMATEREGSITQAVRRAFALYKAVMEAIDSGRRVVIEDRDGGNREVIRFI